MDATLGKSDRLPMTAGRRQSDLDTDATLDKSDRLSTTAGLWQFSDREDLHTFSEAGGDLPPPKSSSFGNLHLRCLPEPEETRINGYP